MSATDLKSDMDQLVVPEATPAAADLVCWIWAAVPPKHGRIHVARAADAFGVSEQTLRRWLADAADRELNEVGLRRATQLAILRSKGHLLWPDLDASSRARAAAKHRYAIRCLQLIAGDPGRVPAEWHRDARLEPHQVLLVSYPRAHAYAITAIRDPKTRRRLIAGGGEVVSECTVDNRYAADLAKYTALEAVDGHRCVAPRSLVPIGHTDCWRETGGHLRPSLALRQTIRSPEAIDTATAMAITGWPSGHLEDLARQGRLQNLPGPAGAVWSRSQLEEMALAELDTRAGRERAGLPDGYWTTMAEAARTLGVSRQHTYRLRSTGRLPARQTATGLWIARRADLERTGS